MKNPFCFNNTDFRDSVGRKYIFRRWPKVDQACEPDNIKWGNQNISEFSIGVRSILMKLISFALIIGALIAIVALKNTGDTVT